MPELKNGLVYNESDLPVNNPLTANKWAVIAVREVIAKDLDYRAAYELMQVKAKENISSCGFAVVVNEVAERLLDKAENGTADAGNNS